ncbi:prepilin peptidase-dependent protein [Xenorhabdus lircayensis]|uniref:Prepilin peptidase-dependent protein n=1 Tax=Xenorhabdus lircayensis TaxID=2763499 RepID=A0ABS0U807_9GAMM|nr:prepilin peptidase-dependent protein [Xenorhabdus lircayensis]MBI6548865.1 prepilin peptidase-dependent protein [Xenorhabdus lircayensis]
MAITCTGNKQRDKAVRNKEIKIREQSGFTLLELLIAMFIISISLSWGLYHWGKYQNRLRLQSAVNNVLSFMERQQALANYLNQDRTLWLVMGKSWCLASVTKIADCDEGDGERVNSPHDDVFLTSSTTERIDFYGVRNTAMPASFILENSAGEISVVISGRGRIRTCSNTISQLPNCEGIKNP